MQVMKEIVLVILGLVKESYYKNINHKSIVSAQFQITSYYYLKNSKNKVLIFYIVTICRNLSNP